MLKESESSWEEAEEGEGEGDSEVETETAPIFVVDAALVGPGSSSHAALIASESLLTLIPKRFMLARNSTTLGSREYLAAILAITSEETPGTAEGVGALVVVVVVVVVLVVVVVVVVSFLLLLKTEPPGIGNGSGAGSGRGFAMTLPTLIEGVLEFIKLDVAARSVKMVAMVFGIVYEGFDNGWGS
jgi:preprotein translocase subunit SecG